ncbi:MAG: haloacid dehalogenase [Roseibacillus sp.]|nr:haloacid dehalogenase [Roseibacillus sp.]
MSESDPGDFPPLCLPMSDSFPWCLVSDLDDTLTGDEEALAELLEYASQGEIFRLVLNSSRPRMSVEKTLAGFPGSYFPRDLVTGMGTEVMVEGEPVQEWEERFSGWQRGVVDEIVEELGGIPHAQEFQTAYKASFMVEGKGRREKVRKAIARCGQPSQIVISGHHDVDILPAEAGKGQAILFVADLLGMDVARQVLVAGDSANDLAMFEISSRGIVVGNARAELREAVKSETAYQASGRHASGVIEGLRHWGVIPRGEVLGEEVCDSFE